jgi:hypothetical protein
MKNPIKQFTSYLIFISALLLLLNQSCAKQGTVLSVQETVLSVEAALVFKSGDVKPVARTEFLLLDKDFETILKESDFTSELPQNLKESLGKVSEISPLRSFALIVQATQMKMDLPEQQKGKAVINASMIKTLIATKSHIVSQTTTDFQGKAEFKDVKPGEYYLFGYTNAGESIAVWNIKTQVKSGQNSIILDQKNADISQ